MDFHRTEDMLVTGSDDDSIHVYNTGNTQVLAIERAVEQSGTHSGENLPKMSVCLGMMSKGEVLLP